MSQGLIQELHTAQAAQTQDRSEALQEAYAILQSKDLQLNALTLRLEHFSAQRIQNLYRTHQLKSALHEAQGTFAKKRAAVRLLQRVWRGHRARVGLAWRHWAATKIQAFVRRGLAQRELRWLKMAKDRQHSAVRRIWGAYQGYRVRRYVYPPVVLRRVQWHQRVDVDEVCGRRAAGRKGLGGRAGVTMGLPGRVRQPSCT